MKKLNFKKESSNLRNVIVSDQGEKFESKSAAWKDTVQYAVSAYSFLILGKEMTGEEFITEIKKRYDANNPRTRALLHALENHLVSIKVRPDGYTDYTTK